MTVIEQSPLIRKKRLSSSAMMFVVAVIALLYCPFFNVQVIGDGYVGDTMIQIRIGMDMLSHKSFLLHDLYSWHENLNWVPHEEGWYFLVGAAYKLMGLAGVIGLASVFNYAMGILIFRENLKITNPYMVVLAAAAARVCSFPNYNARPHLVSMLLVVIFMFYVLDESKPAVRKAVMFPVFVFIMAWFHGGMVPLFFAVFAVFIIIELIYKDYKTFSRYIIGLLAGFAASVLNPCGVEIWTYGLVQARVYDDLWKYNMEWNPKSFTILEITIILIVFVGFAVDKRVREFDKKTITKLCFLCMFLIMSCKYCRFMNYTGLMIAMFGAEEIYILLIWINDNITRFDIKKMKLRDIANYVLTSFCVLFFLFNSVTTWKTYFKTNTMSDCSAIAAYDENVIDIVKEKGYSRIYNSFNTGTWLAFYGIPVHVDNRTDLYMAEYSGVDHLRGKILVTTIYDMDKFVDEYHPDALVLDLQPRTTEDYFAADLYASAKYNVIYDNLCYSNHDPDVSIRWLVVECVYD